MALYQHSLQVSIFEETEKEDILRCQEIVSLPREGDEVSELTEIGSIRLAGGWEQSQIPAVLSLSVKIRCEGVGVSVMDQWREGVGKSVGGRNPGYFRHHRGTFHHGSRGNSFPPTGLPASDSISRDFGVGGDGGVVDDFLPNSANSRHDGRRAVCRAFRSRKWREFQW